MARVLVLTSRWPWPAHGGDKVRILEICRALSQRHELTLLACAESRQVERADEEHMFAAVHRVVIPRWRSLFNSLLALPTRKPLQLAYYYSREYAALCEQLIGKADVVLAHLIRTAQYVPSGAKCGRVLEMTDAMSLSLERAASTRTRFGRLLQFVYGIELERVRRYEKACLAAFDSTSVVSAVDRQYLAVASPPDAGKLLVATLAVPQRDEIQANATAKEILFIGKVGTLPNLDACDFFISECLPKIRARHPEVTFRIVGPVEPEVARQLAEGHSGVIVTGAVPDLKPYIAAAFCGVAPMRKGAGIQTKILDYMSYGLPCVTTPVGYEGLRANVGEEVLVAQDADAIAASVLQLLEQRELARSIGLRGREYLGRYHSWNVCLAPLIDAVDRLSSADRAGGSV
jgi:glycosyltransferase involved in cell wall biosynthesis